MSNDTLPTACIWTNSSYFSNVAYYIQVVIYYYLTILYILVGCTGHIILLIAFYKQSKTERAYGYQVIYSISKILEILIFGTFLFTFTRFTRAVGSYKTGWITRNYFLVFVFAYLGHSLSLAMIICSLLLAVAMAADRVFAVLAPLRYKEINHTVHQLCAALVSFLVGLFGGGIYFSAVKIHWTGENYVAERDNQIEISPIGKFCETVRFVSRVGGLLLLVVLNYLMIYLFKKRLSRVFIAHQDTQSQGQLQNPVSIASNSSRKIKERNLLWITIYQACGMLLNQIPHVVWVHTPYFFPGAAGNWRDCHGVVLGPACDAMVMITDMLDFCIVIAVNSKIRGLVAAMIPKWS